MTKQSPPEPSLQQLKEKLRPRLKAWSKLIVDTAIASKPKTEIEVSRQLRRRLYRQQYRHMLTMLKQIQDPAELTSLLEQSGFLEELEKPRLILPTGVES